jgi:Putative auto-transporter adhesin, head GIN domain
MKKSIIMLAAAAALFMFPSCEKVKGEGPVQTETRAITDFSGVSASIGGKINYKIEPVFKVEIIAQRNILDVIETSKVNGHLLIKVKNGVSIKTNEDIVVNISSPTADYLHLSGSGDLTVTGNIIATKLDMSISGSGSIAVPNVAVADKINAVISGSGNINILAGTTKNQELLISGSGKMLLDGVAAEKAVTTISGSGDIQVKLSQTLDATISGSGSVYYRGNPLVTTHISGSGKVQPL